MKRRELREFKNMENLLNRPAHKGYPGKVYIEIVASWGICDPLYSQVTTEEIEIAKDLDQKYGFSATKN